MTKKGGLPSFRHFAAARVKDVLLLPSRPLTFVKVRGGDPVALLR
ncbi:MAG TPA: hypothetical protein PKH73_00230 [Candidatus Pacearchaeota archaeon]|nr:hypothetical protein [Candidatus Pacearchaeota archaeon]HQD88916.1 hypothetical protein [Candidatus Pacearchaeota archaeon]